MYVRLSLTCSLERSMQHFVCSGMSAVVLPTCRLCARLAACLPDPEGSVMEPTADQHGCIHGHCAHRAAVQLAGRHRHACSEVPKLHGPVGGPCRHGGYHTSVGVVQLHTVWFQDRAGMVDAPPQQGWGSIPSLVCEPCKPGSGKGVSCSKPAVRSLLHGLVRGHCRHGRCTTTGGV